VYTKRYGLGVAGAVDAGEGDGIGEGPGERPGVGDGPGVGGTPLPLGIGTGDVCAGANVGGGV
jgi:hypothetical protein